MVSRAKRLCSPNKIKEELKNIRRFAAYNGFPKWVVKSTIKSCNTTNRARSPDEEDVAVSLFLQLPYLGKEGEQIVRRTKKKLARVFKEKVRINVTFKTKKISFLTSNKDKVPIMSNSFVVYQYECPACSETYVGKTESTLFNRTMEHAWTQKDSAIYQHFHECEGWKHMVGIAECLGDPVDAKELRLNAVRENTCVIGRSDNWQVLAFRESLAIKDRSPRLNTGVKAAKDLCLF